MKQFTIAHISDIHLPLEGVSFPVLSLANKRFLSYLSWKKSRRFHYKKEILDRVTEDIIQNHPDVIAISGDLTNLALPGEFQQAACWLNQLPFSNICVIPGNHDALIKTCWHESYAYWTPWTKAYQFDDYPVVNRIGPVALIGVNSAIPTPPFFAWGTIGKQQMHRLRSILRQTKAENLYRILMIHHPPASGIVCERKALKDRTEFEKIILEEGVEIILYGHSHRTLTERFSSTHIPLLGIASASAISRRHNRQAAWRKIVIYPDERGWHTQITVRFLGENKHFQETLPLSLNDTHMVK